ncbi:hypothetical protein OC846_000834 [Tilletia horrida]|uniref:Uncharacterized protein n=1 Tax=Tilletia horrida TaxID=155126 RepID=A0AAN6K0K9_9BASI|nr:hypothetical protein OC846_000834 [Tilletia horrida]KAK0566684.1 hypothetical protein OC861_003125 [Tilletia horrida]
MGATSSTAQPQPPLVAVDAAGLYSRFTTTRTEELALKVCGDHFFGGSTIKDAKSGEVVFTVRYPFFTWTKKVEILEVGGRLLLTLQEKFFSWRPITYGFDARKPQAASGAATPSLSVIFSSSSNADITFRNWVKSDEKEHQKEVEMQLKIERGFFKPTRATVSNTNGQLAAQMVLGSSAVGIA